MRRLRAKYAAATAAALALLSIAAPARAIGYWNVPGSFYQCYGCGWGAGHHAPLVLGPISHRGMFTTNEVRLPHAPAPYARHAPGHGPFLGATWLNEPVRSTTRSPETLPPPALFGPPVEP